MASPSAARNTSSALPSDPRVAPTKRKPETAAPNSLDSSETNPDDSSSTSSTSSRSTAVSAAISISLARSIANNSRPRSTNVDTRTRVASRARSATSAVPSSSVFAILFARAASARSPPLDRFAIAPRIHPHAALSFARASSPSNPSLTNRSNAARKNIGFVVARCAIAAPHVAFGASPPRLAAAVVAAVKSNPTIPSSLDHSPPPSITPRTTSSATSSHARLSHSYPPSSAPSVLLLSASRVPSVVVASRSSLRHRADASARSGTRGRLAVALVSGAVASSSASRPRSRVVVVVVVARRDG